jgi:hypothetical protein
MASPVRERGEEVRFVHISGNALAAGGITQSFDVNIIPAELSVHTGLSRLLSRAPSIAAVGIVEARFTDGRTATFGPGSFDWAAQVYGQMSGFTWAIEIVRGEMTGWMFMQVWE